MSKRLVCLCNFVTEKEIKELLKKGAETTSEIQKMIKAGTTCGRCLPEIDELVRKNKKPENRQGKIDFGL